MLNLKIVFRISPQGHTNLLKLTFDFHPWLNPFITIWASTILSHVHARYPSNSISDDENYETEKWKNFHSQLRITFTFCSLHYVYNDNYAPSVCLQRNKFRIELKRGNLLLFIVLHFFRLNNSSHFFFLCGMNYGITMSKKKKIMHFYSYNNMIWARSVMRQLCRFECVFTATEMCHKNFKIS